MVDGICMEEEMKKKKKEEEEGMMNAMKNRAREEGLFVVLRRFKQKKHTRTHPALLPPMHYV